MIKLNKIKAVMVENGDTQEKLAVKLGVSKQLLNLKLTGKSPFSVKMLGSIARIYGARTADFIED